VHLLVEVRQVVFPRSFGHLGGRALAVMLVIPVTVAAAPPTLVVALQLVVDHDAFHPPATALNGACRVLVGAVGVDIMFELARALDARVEGLGGRTRASGAPPGDAPPPGQPDRVVAGAGDTHGLDQPLFPQLAQVTRPWFCSGTAVIQEITTGDHSEPADRGQCARFGSPPRVLAPAVVHDLTRRSAWQVRIALEHVARKAVAVLLAAGVVAGPGSCRVVSGGRFGTASGAKGHRFPVLGVGWG
jgi:hypothetical protein